MKGKIPLNLSKEKPYEGLDPNLILNAIEHCGFKCSGSLLALNSYENRVYQVGLEDEAPIIAKFYRPFRWTNEAILEEHQFSQELITHEIPVVAPLANAAGETLHHYQTFRFALFPRKGGRTLELDNLEQLEWMGRFLGRLHAIGACQSFQHRSTLDIESHGYDSYRFLIENQFIPFEISTLYCQTVEALLKKVEAHFHKVGHLNNIRLHGDCHAGNVLWNDAGPQIVDLDDCLMGPSVQDIWMLLSGDEHSIQQELHIILRGYEEFYDFNYRECHLIESLRALRMLRYSAWLARRWTDPAFPINFPWFNTLHYWQSHLQHLIQLNITLGESLT